MLHTSASGDPAEPPGAATTESAGGEYAEYQMYERMADARVKFFRHAVVFLFVNAAVYGADFFLTAGVTFAPWVTFIWAFFIFFHFMKAFILQKDQLEKMKQHQVDKLMGNK